MHANKNNQEQEGLGVLMQRFFTNLTPLKGKNTTFGNLYHDSKTTITKVLNKLKYCLFVLSQKNSYNLQDEQRDHVHNNNPDVDTFKKLESSLSGSNSSSPGNVVTAKPTADEFHKKDIDSIRKAVRKLSDFQENKATSGEMKATLEEALGALNRATKRAESEAKKGETNKKSQRKKLKKAFNSTLNVLKKVNLPESENKKFEDLTKKEQKKVESGIQQCQTWMQPGRNNYNNREPNTRLSNPITQHNAEQRQVAMAGCLQH